MRIYYGWVIVAIAVIGYTVVMGATTNAFGIFVVPVSQELHLSRAAMNTAFAFTSIGSGVMAPFVGRALDYVPARPILIASTLLMGLGFVILSQAHSMWLWILALAVLIPIGIDGGALITLSVLVARWFKVQRTRAIALSVVGMSLGSIVMPVPVSLLVQTFGWRMALLTIGAFLTIALLAAALLIREHPGADDIEPGSLSPASADKRQGPGADGQPVRVRDLLKMKQFWLIGTSVSIALGVLTAIAITLVPLGLGKGLTLVQATSLLTILGATSIGAKLLLAWIGKRANILSLTAVIYFLGVPVNIALNYASSYVSLFACAAALGLCAGMTPALMQTLVADRFGLASYGTIRGLITPLSALSLALCSRFAGEVFDRTGSYHMMFLTFMALHIVAAAMILAVRSTAPLACRSDEVGRGVSATSA